MSSAEKGTWLYLIVNALTYVAYLAIVLGRSGTTPLVEVDYVPVMLGAIGAAVGLTIVGRIAIEIAGPRETHRPDVRDREIDHFGEYVGGVTLAVGMVLPFGLTLAEFDHFWIGNAIYLVFSTYAFIGSAIKLVAYRRGI